METPIICIKEGIINFLTNHPVSVGNKLTADGSVKGAVSLDGKIFVPRIDPTFLKRSHYVLGQNAEN